MGIELTEQGRALVPRLPLTFARVAHQLFADFSASELNQLSGMFARMLANLHEDDWRPRRHGPARPCRSFVPRIGEVQRSGLAPSSTALRVISRSAGSDEIPFRARKTWRGSTRSAFAGSLREPHLVIGDNLDEPVLASASPMIEGRDFFVDDLLPSCRGAVVEPVSMPEAPLFLMYTSGTTGRPKGCQHSNGG